MNRLFIKTILALAVISVITVSVTFAQGKPFYVKGRTTAELSQYVGQRVQYPTPKNTIVYNARVFTEFFGGTFDEIYTIKSVNGEKICQVLLEDPSGKTILLKIAPGSKGKTMDNMDAFLLYDKFEQNKNKYLNMIINNSEGQPVAKVVDIVYDSYYSDKADPKAFYVKSNFDNSTVELTKVENANELCKPYGIVLSHPLVKNRYKVVGASTDYYRGGGIKYQKYHLQNLDDPNDIRECAYADFDTFFNEDTKIHYHSNLVKVEKPKNPAIRYGKTTVQSDNNVSKFSYVDNVIDILIFSGEKEFDFVLKNVSDNSIKVIWNEAVFVGYDGSSSKIMHVGTKYAQRDGDQPPTTIIKGAKIEDCAIPNCNVKLIYSEWQVLSMFPLSPTLEPIQLRLMLPIQIKDVINEYVFVFEADWSYDHPERLILK